MWQDLLQGVLSGNVKALSRSISSIENEVTGYEELLERLPANDRTKIIGITGPPGAGKSTLTDALIGLYAHDNNKVAVLCIDPSSHFTTGALLGDRIRMSRWYTNDSVYIRSLASRGSMGGLNPKIIEITELIRAARYDYIFVETVGVGQSEVEIASLADVTVVVMVPESGDQIQTMKAGLMEIADIFVVNKGDREGADLFVNNLQMMLAPVFKTSEREIPVLKTIASEKKGLDELKERIGQQLMSAKPEKKYWLLAEKAFYLIQNYRMRSITKKMLQDEIIKCDPGSFNLYSFVKIVGNRNT